ncbi:ABC transporter ATP-binding protein [Rhizorhapis suberifaciens]|uniref:Iron complex transport system ATP-binding protein n=1 Tax=Rhizorhapis suberifaciens TaxID=13656 RepID=A0A840HRD0_9SPHN|nr:ABC transporter ATP-binding protein [Rhizorhapis suberifaciens]MBB4640116.1 iron complex transport system ATP-binding protein [Rhizorhapis suberifaciens]
MDMEFKGVSLTLRGRKILADVSGAFSQGRVTVILGANGAGKSTLLSCLAGLRRPDSGSIAMAGRDIQQLDRRERARMIGLLPQQGDIHWDIDVETLVGLGRIPHRGRWGMSEADHQAVANAMEATDSGHLAKRNILRLSGGEQGRVLLARVLAGEPQWLLADEPLASLDPAHQLDVLDRLRQCAHNGAGVAVVLHDLTQAARIADDILALKDGAVLAGGRRDQVLTPAVLAQAYGVEVHIGKSPSGDPMVVPVRRIV